MYVDLAYYSGLKKIRNIIESAHFEHFIVVIIVLNGIILGLETAPVLVGDWMSVLLLIDKVFLSIFVVEIIAKLAVYRWRFFMSGWNVFDFAIVAVSLMPFFAGLSGLRSLRILRVLRLITVVPQFRVVTQAFFDSLSGLVAIGSIIGLFFYIGAVMSTKLFGSVFPEWFGTMGDSFFTLFQIMTLESWSMGIVRPVMEVYPLAWLFFVPFILLTTFTAINLLIGVIVNSMQTVHDDTIQVLDEHMTEQDKERTELQKHVKVMEQSLKELKERL